MIATKDEYCGLQADRERHISQCTTCGEYLNEKAKQLLMKFRQAGVPFSWLAICS